MKFDACPICGSNHIEKQITSEIFEYNPHVLADTTKHETLAKFEKWS